MPLLNLKAENIKYQETPEELLRKLQEEIKVEGPEQINKCDGDIKEKMCERISNWQTHFEGGTLEADRSEVLIF